MIYLSTPFSIESAIKLKNIGIKAFKIGSGECNNTPLLEKIASLKKPIILSTGMNDLKSIERSVKILKKKRAKFILLHCKSEYPANIKGLKLDFINTLQPRRFKWETRDGNIKDGKIRAGFIAQELQSAQEDYKYLDLVMENNPERLEAKQEHLVPVLVQAIKELSAQNEALVARITALESN